MIFDPLVYPMDTAWLDGKVPADHYRHARPSYYRALQRANLIELPAEPADDHVDQHEAETEVAETEVEVSTKT